MNPDQKITIRDMPHRIRGTFGNLSSKEMTQNAEAGRVISEVGDGTFVSHPAMESKFYAYKLRQKRTYKVPGHVFGKAHIGDAFSAFLSIPFTVPAVGSSITLNPVVTYEQSVLLNLYKYTHASAYWIVVVPSPLGTGLMLRAYAPEVDVTTETRGVRWRTQTMPCVAFDLPWSNDVTMISKDAPRQGQSGLSLKIQTVEDNSVVDLNTPITGVAFCCVHDLNLSGLRETNFDPVRILGLDFSPVAGAFHEEVPDIIVQMMEEELNADATNSVLEEDSQTSVANVVALPIEKLAPGPKKPKKTAASKNQTGNLNAIWIDWVPVVFSAMIMNVFQNLTFNPYTFTNRGESFNLPYRRNIWTSGNRTKGYVTTIAIKWPIPRPPQISGIFEVVDSRNKSSRTIILYGETKELEVMPRNFSIVPPTPVRYVNNPWLRTNEAAVDFRYRLLCQNRNGDIADISTKLMVRPSGTIFQGPVKPRARASALGLDWMVEELEIALDTITLHMDDGEGEQIHDAPSTDITDDTNSIAPLAGDQEEFGETNETSGEGEYLDQSEFGIEVFRGEIPINEPIVIPLNLSVITDFSGDGTNNPLTQIFERYVHVQPGAPGPFGPRVGKYIIKVRLPATIAGDIAHVYLPNDVNDEAVAFTFGLTNILGIATAALQGIGGPLLSGAVQVGRNILGGTLSKLLGGITSKFNNSDTADNVALGGDLSLSRFMNFLKPIAQNEALDPTFGSLLIQARDFFDNFNGRILTTIPISVFARMDNFEVERAAWVRTTVPLMTLENRIWLPRDRLPYFIDLFNSNTSTLVEGSIQNIAFRKLISVLMNRNLSTLKTLALDEITSETPISQMALQQIIARRTLFL